MIVLLFEFFRDWRFVFDTSRVSIFRESFLLSKQKPWWILTRNGWLRNRNSLLKGADSGRRKEVKWFCFIKLLFAKAQDAPWVENICFFITKKRDSLFCLFHRMCSINTFKRFSFQIRKLFGKCVKSRCVTCLKYWH